MFEDFSMFGGLRKIFNSDYTQRKSLLANFRSSFCRTGRPDASSKTKDDFFFKILLFIFNSVSDK